MVLAHKVRGLIAFLLLSVLFGRFAYHRKTNAAKTLIGTPAYMSPEVFSQDGAYSFACDGMLLV
jgi:serine/threonine protein kinase